MPQQRRRRAQRRRLGFRRLLERRRGLLKTVSLDLDSPGFDDDNHLPRCRKCSGCTTVLKTLDRTVKMGPHQYTNEPGASPATLFKAGDIGSCPSHSHPLPTSVHSRSLIRSTRERGAHPPAAHLRGLQVVLLVYMRSNICDCLLMEYPVHDEGRASPRGTSVLVYTRSGET